MIEEMMEELNRELEKTFKLNEQVRQNIQQTKKDMKIKDKSPKKIVTKEIIQKKAPQYTIPKVERFQDSKKLPKQKVDDELDESQLSILSVTSAIDLIKKGQTNVIFPKSERFKKDEIDERSYNVSQYQSIKKETIGGKINPPKKQNLITSNASASQFDDLETQASLSVIEPGPGHYNVKFDQIELKKNVTMSKAERFKKEEIIDQPLLKIKYDYVEKKAKGVVMKAPTKKTKQQKLKEYEEQQQEAQKAKIELEKPLDNDKCIRTNVPSAIMNKIEAAPFSSKERKFMIFYLLDKINEERGQGPAMYQIPEKKSDICMVRYRSLSPVSRKGDLNSMPYPGPDYYYSKDDLIKIKQPKWTFNKVEREKKIKIEDLDKKDYDPNFDVIKRRVSVGGVIDPLPENQSEIPNYDLLIQQNLGPGTYNQNYKLTEQRNDIGIQKFPDLNEKNAREVLIDPIHNKEIFDNEDLNPNLDAVKPNIKGFQYHGPIEIQPDNLPDVVLYPEQWKFYDVDLNNVKEDQSKGIKIGGGKNRDEFLEHEEFMNMMHAYFDREKRQPQIGEYDLNFNQKDKKMMYPNFKKYLIKDLIEPIEKKDGDVEGDNLILNPDKLKKRVPEVKIKKYSSRNNDEITDKKKQHEYQEELKIDPNYNPVRPKVIGLVNIKKQVRRPDYEEEKEKASKKEVVDIQINYKQIDPKVKGNVGFKGQEKRPEGPKPKEQEVNIQVNDEGVKPRVTGGKF